VTGCAGTPASGCRVHRVHELAQQHGVQAPVAPHAVAQVQALGLHLTDRLRNVVGAQPTCQPQRHRPWQSQQCVTDVPAQTSVVCAAGATQFFGGRLWPTRIEQHRIDKRCHGQGFVDGVLVHHVNDLHQFNLGAQQAK
jgi:hypothetical protein